MQQIRKRLPDQQPYLLYKLLIDQVLFHLMKHLVKIETKTLQPARMVFGLRSRKFSVPGLSANPYSTISGWEMGTCSRPLKPEDWKLVQNSSLTLELRVTESPMWSPGVIALLGISSPSHLTKDKDKKTN